MNHIKIIFIGTGEVGEKLLRALHQDSHFEILLVVTGTDKPAGRKMELQPSAIKKAALELGVEVFQPENIKSSESVEKLKKLEPDIILVMAYGQILSQAILDLPKIDCLNVHASLLPKYRGASPIQSVILNGEKQTGITLMKMVKQMDAGAMYESFEINIDDHQTTASLEEKLSELSAKKIPAGIVEIVGGKLKPVEQNEAKATYVTKISKADGQINWNETAEIIQRKIRAYNPWPSSYTFFKGKRLKILGAIPHDLEVSEIPGTVIKNEEWAGVVTGTGVLQLVEVQPEGKKPQLMKEFLNGNGKFLKIKLE